MRTWTVPLLMFVLSLGSLLGCLVTNQNHCGLNQGACGPEMLCSICEVENNGCVLPESLSQECQFGSAGMTSEGTSTPSTTASTQPTTDTTNPTEVATGQNSSTSGELTTDPLTSTDPSTSDPVTTTDVSTSTTGVSMTEASTTGTSDGSTTDTTAGPERQFLITYTGPIKDNFSLNATGLTVTKAELMGADELHHLTSLTVFARKGGCGTPEGQADTSIVSVCTTRIRMGASFPCRNKR